ncbi:outer membrane beta-barrel protein [Sinomicrobium weinanense]|uniref:Outer membrane beta-barrel protein n=1 Tax=Sinomicrobium weinanense TaxID=2842200 RepID=A0A926JP40_9FLAO|nr:outer membrane beta-barrel protein [Sinomicrobium weinanense]MBC9794878.1 outer membrane beta-barrel protein [Sinomicrobium weinanense]MBU3125649.1 outer membrane beta-barrel protein [Sinomicrobium weinanense]
MKQKILLTFLLIFSMKLFAQNSKFSIEASYPILINEKANNRSFIDFNGIIDLGVKYNITENRKINFDIGLNTSYLKFKVDDGGTKFTRNHYIFQPKLFGRTKLFSYPNIDFSLGLGYAFDFDSTGDNAFKSKTYNGVNLNAGLYYPCFKQIFFHVQFDTIFYNKELVYYNKNLSMIKVGVGLKL